MKKINVSMLVMMFMFMTTSVLSVNAEETQNNVISSISNITVSERNMEEREVETFEDNGYVMNFDRSSIDYSLMRDSLSYDVQLNLEKTENPIYNIFAMNQQIASGVGGMVTVQNNLPYYHPEFYDGQWITIETAPLYIGDVFVGDTVDLYLGLGDINDPLASNLFYVYLGECTIGE